jgi:hypothetical protein
MLGTSRLRKNSFGVSFRGVPRPRDDEESRIVLKTLRARFLSRACGIGMTAWKGFSSPCCGLGKNGRQYGQRPNATCMSEIMCSGLGIKPPTTPIPAP